MSKNRIDRINDEMRDELSALFRTVKDPRVQNAMISITRVETTGDLRYAKVYVSVLEKSREKEVIKGLKSAGGYLRRQIGANMGLRYTPELVFEADDSIEHGAHILEVLKSIEKKDEDRNGGE
jgi:ribosome-binding factor A